MLHLGSKPRQKLFAYYFTNPSADHYIRELAELLNVDPANLFRELTRLEREGLFVSQKRGKQKYFRLNRSYPLYEEIRGIVLKTVGAVGQLQKALKQIPGIQGAHLYGSFARNQHDAASDIDILLIGKPKADELEPAIRKIERQLHRQINYTLFSPEEFRARLAAKDAFLEDIWRHKKITLLAAS